MERQQQDPELAAADLTVGLGLAEPVEVLAPVPTTSC
jgi:hypothetical protein